MTDASAPADHQDVPAARLGRLLWERLPAWVGRVSLLVARALADGAFLRRWPLAACLTPLVAALAGLALGALHPEPVFSVSVVVLGVLSLVSGFGAGVGCWTWIGFVVGDLVVSDRSTRTGHGLVALVLGFVLVSLLLWGLLVVVPMLARSCRSLVGSVLSRRAGSRLGRSVVATVGVVVQLVVQAVCVVGWAQASAFMIRPVWSLSGGSPSITAIRPLQAYAIGWALIATVALAGRLWLERLAGGNGNMIATRPSIGDDVRPWPVALRIVGQVGVLTLLLSGLVATPAQGVALVTSVLLIVLARLVLVPRLQGWMRIVTRVPAAVRFGLCLLLGVVLAQVVVVPAAEAGQQSFVIMVGVVLISMAVGAFLLPGTRGRSEPRHARVGPAVSPTP